MARHSSRRSIRSPRILEPDRSEFITELGRLRGRVCTMIGTLAIRSVEYKALGAHLGRIDDLVELLTGDRERFWTPPTSV